MNESEIDLQTAKQRRNVIGISFVLILIEWADIHFGPSGYLQGVTYIVENPIAIYWALNIVLVYFFVRFMQCFIADEAWTKLWKAYGDVIVFGRRGAVLSRLHKKESLEQDPRNNDQLHALADTLQRSGGMYKFNANKWESIITRLEPSDWSAINEHEFSMFWVFYVDVRSLIRWVVFDRFLTDYYLPLILAIYAASIGLVDWII